MIEPPSSEIRSSPDRPIHIHTVAQQEFHSYGLSQGRCFAETATPNLENKFA